MAWKRGFLLLFPLSILAITIGGSLRIPRSLRRVKVLPTVIIVVLISSLSKSFQIFFLPHLGYSSLISLTLLTMKKSVSGCLTLWGVLVILSSSNDRRS